MTGYWNGPALSTDHWVNVVPKQTLFSHQLQPREKHPEILPEKPVEVKSIVNICQYHLGRAQDGASLEFNK
jgi:hypothetical protein